MGKTTTAHSIRERAPAWRLFDPEHVGLLLRLNLVGVEFDDFQDLPPWRSLVPRIAGEVSDFTGDDLLAVQTVLVRDYWEEMRAGFRERELEVVHVLLDAPARALEARIEADEIERGAKQWRLDHISAYESAKSWLLPSADLVVDTERLSVADSASCILDALG